VLAWSYARQPEEHDAAGRCPLGSAIGLVDTMRIGADTARRWLPSFKGHQFFIQSEPDLPSARNASHNALTRAALHQRWWINDPDCLLLRPQTKLTLAEIQTQATIIALTGGSFFLSDHIPELSPERRRIAEALLPLIGKRPFVLDWFDSSTPTRLQLDEVTGRGICWPYSIGKMKLAQYPLH
jgi:alpha-galactosidase